MMRRWCLHHTTSCTWSTQSKTKTVQRGPKKPLRPCLTCLSLQPAAPSIAVHFCFSSELAKTVEPNWPPKTSQMCSKTILKFDIKYGQFSAKAPQKLTEAKHPCSSNCEVSTEVRHSQQLKSHMFQMMRRWCLHHTTSCTWSTQSKTKTVQRGPKKPLRPCLTCLSLQPAAPSIAVHFCFSSELAKTAEPNWPPKASLWGLTAAGPWVSTVTSAQIFAQARIRDDAPLAST